MSVYQPPPNDPTPRRRHWDTQRHMARLAMIRNRQALENGGLERLDVAALRLRLEERKTKDATRND